MVFCEKMHLNHFGTALHVSYDPTDNYLANIGFDSSKHDAGMYVVRMYMCYKSFIVDRIRFIIVSQPCR